MKTGRPRDPLTPYRVRERVMGKYRYAATQAYMLNEETGRTDRRIVLWGRLTEDNTFLPNQEFMLLAPAERDKLIFPADWDLSEITKLPSQRGRGRPAYENADQDLLYGAVWFADQVVKQLDIDRDLLEVFGGNREKMLDVVSLAIYLCVTGEPFSHMADWQDLEWYPAVRRLTPGSITRLMQTITEEDRLRFTGLRRKRLGKNNVCAVDSTTRGSCGKSLPDVAVGPDKKTPLKVPQTTEAVVYSLSSHEPLYYRTFPGNMPDSKTLRTILKDLRDAGYKAMILVTDRGYEGVRNLEMCILCHQKLITAAKVRQKKILERIRDIGDFGSKPPGMEWIAEEEVFARQYELAISLKGRGGRIVKADKARLNLYFDPVARGREQAAFQNLLDAQKCGIEECMADGIPIADEECISYAFYRLKRDKETKLVESFELDENKVKAAQECFGFFANFTLGIDYTAAEALHTYGLRDEQEKYFHSMKSRIDCDMQRSWSEKARRGCRFVEFIALIIISRIRHVWTTSESLRKTFSYIHAMILTMRQIHLYEHTGKEKQISMFLKKQILICAEFNLQIPAGCEPEYASLEIRPTKKRGRPKKQDATH